MRRLWQKKTALLFALLFLAAEVLTPIKALAYTVESPKEDTAGMELVAQTDQAELYLDREDALLCLVDKSSGAAVKTKIMDGDSGNANIKANQKSDFIISYYKDIKAANTLSQANYTMAVEPGQMEFTEVENGIKIAYTLKEDKLSLDCVPKYISEERMTSLVLDYLSVKEREWISDFYRLYDGVYTRTRDGGELQSTIRAIYKLFYEVGQYTEEDLEADNAESGYESEWSNLEIRGSVEYTLDGGDLVVRMPLEELTTNNEEVILYSVTLLPYFLSAGQEEKGYYVMPDGAGAVINFNNGKVFATDYNTRVYGGDVLLNTEPVPVADYSAMMPVIGAVYEDYALLAIVEDGQGAAEINARISGKTDNYNTAWFTFYLTEKENVASTISSGVMVNRCVQDPITGDLAVRYKMITDAEETNYTGLAHLYRQYLTDKNVLSVLEDRGAELYLELLGATLEAKTFLGFPYRGVKSLTSFKEAAGILEDLSGRGVNDAVIQLDGWLDGGQRHENLSKVKLEGEQGGKKSFNALAERAESLGYGLYPDVAMQYIYPSFDLFQKNSAKNYAKKYGSRYLSNQYAWHTEIAMASFTSRFSMIWSPYLLSPSHLANYTQKAVKGLSKLDVKGVTVMDMGVELIGDYNDKAPVNRENALDKVAESMDILEQSFDLVMKAPYQYAWKGVRKMSDMPTRSTEYTVFDYDIPFLQLVLDGCASYSTEPLNYQTQKDTSELLLKCIETRSNPKFYVMEAQMSDLRYALYADYYSINYGEWAERIAQVYNEYAAFAGKVADSNIALHETVAEKLVKVTYENGLTVYVNYGDKTVSADGKEVAGRSYLVVE